MIEADGVNSPTTLKIGSHLFETTNKKAKMKTNPVSDVSFRVKDRRTVNSRLHLTILLLMIAVLPSISRVKLIVVVWIVPFWSTLKSI